MPGPGCDDCPSHTPNATVGDGSIQPGRGEAYATHAGSSMQLWHGVPDLQGETGGLRWKTCWHECQHGTVCWACPAARKWKSSTQPDGGEGLAKRKGATARKRLKEAWSKSASR